MSGDFHRSKYQGVLNEKSPAALHAQPGIYFRSGYELFEIFGFDAYDLAITHDHQFAVLFLGFLDQTLSGE